MKLRHRVFHSLLFLGFILPIAVMAMFSYAHLSRDLNNAVFDRRSAMAEISATFIKEKLDHMVDLGISFAARPYFIKYVREGKWDEAREILRNTLTDFSFIHLFFLTDMEGTLKAGLPQDDELIDQNFAFRDWYKGVSRDWRPYVSEVYETRYTPFYKVVAITVPIRDEGGIPIGIMAFLVKLDVFAQWINNYKFGRSGFLFIVDHRGHIIAHPSFPPQGDIVDFSGIPSVQRVLRGQEGSIIFYNEIEKEERLAVFKPVSGYGWGCIVGQSTAEAFEVRDTTLKIAALLYFLVLLFSSSLILLVLHYLSVRRISEEKARSLNVELAKRFVQLKDVNKELEAFSYSVSHDLRAPLRSIDGFSHIILEEYVDRFDEKGRGYFERIRAAAQHMAELIDDLLSLARVSRSELHFEEVDLSALARKIADSLKERHPGRDVEFLISPGMTARGDSLLLEGVLINLLENSWKFTSKHVRAKIEFGEFKEKGKDVFFVRDDGAGFDMNYAAKLFGAFQRLHTQGEFPGTGIGLATARRIIHRHGGSIWAEAAVEKGAAFYFTLGG